MSLSIAIHTLGCKVNQCDAEELARILEKNGHNAFHSRDFTPPADVIVINSCTVTHVSDKKSRQMIRRAKKNGAFVALCGCMAKKTQSVDDVDFVFDARSPEGFLEKLKSLTPSHPYRDKKKIKTRAFIKIQDGCDRFCSYCIVPYVRGAVVSRPLSEILAQAEAFIENGALEIVLTGIQVASYGNDMEKTCLPSLIAKVSALRGLKRLRLSSIDPCAVDENFLETIAKSPNLCNHFHLSLQSGCDDVLKKMNRRYTAEQFEKAAMSLLKINPDTALTTDIIVGFPGESDSCFEKSLEFVKKMAFARVHVFEFSARKGTAAADFPGQIPEKIKNERGKAMREAAETLQKNFLTKQVGKTLDVLFEKEKSPSLYIGNSENYCPVLVKSLCDLTNTIEKVQITACSGESLTGKLA